MSTALAVHHGAFGRVTLYLLNREMTTHAHREGHLIFHVDGGHGSVAVRGRRGELHAGRAAAISPWEPHGFRPARSGEPTLCLVLYIRQGWFLETSRSAEGGLRFGAPMIDVRGQVAALVRRVTAILLTGEDVPMLDGYLAELTRECFDQSWQWAPGRGGGAGGLLGFTDFRVRRSMRLIGEKLGASDLLLDEVARDSGLSRAHFYKLFRRQTGITPNLYLNTLRMERAIDGLTASDRTITDIGFDLGFASQASFSRFFCSNVGIPPTDYRRIARTGLN